MKIIDQNDMPPPPLSLESELSRPERAADVIDAALCTDSEDPLRQALLQAYLIVQGLARSPDRTRALNEIRSAALWARQARQQ